MGGGESDHMSKTFFYFTSALLRDRVEHILVCFCFVLSAVTILK